MMLRIYHIDFVKSTVILLLGLIFNMKVTTLLEKL